MHLPLHRFQSCQPLKDDICLPDNFDLEQYLEAGQIEYLYQKDIQLKLQFTHEAGQHLFETPIDPSQEIDPLVSVPIATSTMPTATATAEPELDPQGLKSNPTML